MQLLINLRKESNMTPKQWYDLGDAVIQVSQSESKKIASRNNIYNRREAALASGRKASQLLARTEKLLTVTTDPAMVSAEMEIASGLKASPRRARNWTTFT